MSRPEAFDFSFAEPLGTDPDTGFPIVWESGTETNIDYSLVRVPRTEPVTLAYDKPKAKLDFTITPIPGDVRNWQLVGEVDSDIVSLLNLPIDVIPRRGKVPPQLTDEEELRDYGLVDVTNQTFDDGTERKIYDVSLKIPTPNINNLLEKLWRPKALTGKPSPIRLGSELSNVRILPQKFPSEKGDSRGEARLRVISLQPK